MRPVLATYRYGFRLVFAVCSSEPEEAAAGGRSRATRRSAIIAQPTLDDWLRRRASRGEEQQSGKIHSAVQHASSSTLETASQTDGCADGGVVRDQSHRKRFKVQSSAIVIAAMTARVITTPYGESAP